MASKWLDPSHSCYEGMPYNKLLGPPKIEPVYTLDDHLTHMDAPNHFIRGGKSVDQIPPEQTAGTAVVLDIPKPPCAEITVADLEKATPKVRRGDIVFFARGGAQNSTQRTITIIPISRAKAPSGWWIVGRKWSVWTLSPWTFHHS